MSEVGEQAAGQVVQEGAAVPPETAAPARSDDDIVREALAAESARPDASPDGGPSEPGQQAAHPALRQPPQPGSASVEPAIPPLPPGEVFERLGIDPKTIDPALHGVAAETLAKLYREHYEPAARDLAGQYQEVQRMGEQQQAWYAELQELLAEPAYQIAAQLADDPQLMAAWQNFLRGGTSAAPAGGAGGAAPGAAQLAQINPDDLDEQSRAIYAIAQQALQAQEALQGELAELRQWRDQTEQRFTRWDEQRRAAEHQASFEAVRPQVRSAVETISRELGFDVRAYPKEFRELVDGVQRYLESEQYRASTNPHAAPAQFDLVELFRRELDRSGLRAIGQRIARQRQTSAAPPSGRRNGAAVAPQSDEDIVSEALAQLHGG